MVIFLYKFFLSYLIFIVSVPLHLCKEIFSPLVHMDNVIYLHIFTIVDAAHLLSTQGDQHSPGVIPLAIKDVFSMIQDVSGYLFMKFIILKYF